MASSTPPRWPSLTRRSLGHGRTAALLVPSYEQETPACWAPTARKPSTAPTAPPLPEESLPRPPPLQRRWSPNAHQPLRAGEAECVQRLLGNINKNNKKQRVTLKCCVFMFGDKEAEHGGKTMGQKEGNKGGKIWRRSNIITLSSPGQRPPSSSTFSSSTTSYCSCADFRNLPVHVWCLERVKIVSV